MWWAWPPLPLHPPIHSPCQPANRFPFNNSHPSNRSSSLFFLFLYFFPKFFQSQRNASFFYASSSLISLLFFIHFHFGCFASCQHKHTCTQFRINNCLPTEWEDDRRAKKGIDRKRATKNRQLKFFLKSNRLLFFFIRLRSNANFYVGFRWFYCVHYYYCYCCWLCRVMTMTRESRWLPECTDNGWMAGWMDGWIDGWITKLNPCTKLFSNEDQNQSKKTRGESVSNRKRKRFRRKHVRKRSKI